ncbi:PulJ/GspJ family protein [Pseudokineococcus sp. 1T1Z-3]|uniref:PulJ/GspJ family protein n=1 Tax=Pseudokineococcus sp. 1T1Z-3 TaxID=3132745 RepID=UPI0030AE97B2
MHPTRSRTAASGGEGGFTLVEVLVAMTLLVALGASFITFFVRSAGLSQSLQRKQAAVALADQALELTRSVTAAAPTASGSPVVRGRSGAAVDAQWASAPSDVAALLATTSPLSDPLATSASVPVVPLTSSATVSGQPYTVDQYVGTCRRATTAAAACTAASTGPVALRVVVAVSWSAGEGTSCSGSPCRFVAATLIDPSTAPQFMVNGGSIGGQLGVARADTATVKAGSATQINVKSNDAGTLDPDRPVSDLTPSTGFKGAVALAGTSVGAVTYTAPTAAALSGVTGWSAGNPYEETFTYVLTDSRLRTSSATVTIEVVP